MKKKFALLLLGLWPGSGAWLTAQAQLQDYGDAPSPFPTVLSANGARHPTSGPRLGSLIDGESDGQPNATATGDDINPAAADDQDGAGFPHRTRGPNLAPQRVGGFQPRWRLGGFRRAECHQRVIVARQR